VNILLVNTRHFYGGGDSTYTFSLGELLRDNGHNVSFFAMQDERNLPDPNKDLFVSPIDFREINRDKNLVNGLKVMGRVIYSQEARRKFSRMLDRVKPDIVHLQNIYMPILHHRSFSRPNGEIFQLYGRFMTTNWFVRTVIF